MTHIIWCSNTLKGYKSQSSVLFGENVDKLGEFLQSILFLFHFSEICIALSNG